MFLLVAFELCHGVFQKQKHQLRFLPILLCAGKVNVLQMSVKFFEVIFRSLYNKSFLQCGGISLKAKFDLSYSRIRKYILKHIWKQMHGTRDSNVSVSV